MTKSGKLYVFTGPSGTGKGTMLGHILNIDKNLFLSVSATTRSAREGEIDGKHYYFLDKEEFKQKIENGDFLEHAQYLGNYYGTLEKPVEQKLIEGSDVLLEIEVQGAMQIKQKRSDAVMIFVAPPSIDELERRLIKRGTEKPDKISERIETAKKELEQSCKFDYIIVNDNLDDAVNDFIGILRAERCKVKKI